MRVAKTPKLFWTDTGLCSSLPGLSDLAHPESDPLPRGSFSENFAMMEPPARLHLALTSARLFHLRNHDQLETDGVIGSGRKK